MTEVNTFPVVFRKTAVDTLRIFPVVKMNETKRAITVHAFAYTSTVTEDQRFSEQSVFDGIISGAPYKYVNIAQNLMFKGSVIGALCEDGGYTYIGSSSLDLDSDIPMSSYEAAPCGNWMWMYSNNTIHFPFNKTPNTYITKLSSSRYTQENQKSCALQLYMPFGCTSTDTIDMFNMSLLYNPEHGYVSDIVFDTEVSLETINTNTNVFSRPEMAFSTADNTQIAVNGSVTLSAFLYYGEDKTPIHKEGVEIFITSTGGYLPYNRVVTDSNGEISFDVYALHMTPDTTFKVKLDTKSYTGMAEITLDVVAAV